MIIKRYHFSYYSFALQTNERSTSWQNLISTCAAHI